MADKILHFNSDRCAAVNPSQSEWNVKRTGWNLFRRFETRVRLFNHSRHLSFFPEMKPAATIQCARCWKKKTETSARRSYRSVFLLLAARQISALEFGKRVAGLALVVVSDAPIRPANNGWPPIRSCLTSLTDRRHGFHFVTAKWRIMPFLFAHLSFITSFVIETCANLWRRIVGGRIGWVLLLY